MKQYFFLAPFLPQLKWEEKPQIFFEELKERLKQNLLPKDRNEMRVLLQFVDISNIRTVLLEEPIDSKGNLNEKELDEAILFKYLLPDYVFEFLDRFENASEKLKHFSGVFALFFSEEIKKNRGFLKRYFTFERGWRLVLTALRCKKTGRDLIRELQFEDLTDPLVLQILAQKDADQYDPPLEYQGLKERIESCQADPWKEKEVFDKYRFDQIEEMVEGELFSLGRILAYTAQLAILEYRLELNVEKGKMILDTFKTN